MKILITGARSGIGFDTGLELVKRGHTVYFTTHTNEEAIALSSQLKNFPNAKCFKLDVTKERDKALITNLELDCLISHAGIGEGGSLLGMDINVLKKNYDVNIFSNLSLIKTFYNSLGKRPGKVFVTSSLAGFLPICYLESYTSSKAALTMIVRTLRKELEILQSNCHISLIQPGAYKTGFNEVMIDNKEINLDKGTIWYQEKDLFTKRQRLLFDLISKRSNRSIVRKIVKNVLRENPKFYIRAPLLQVVFVKLYTLFTG